MPAPSGSYMKSQAVSLYGMPLGPEALAYLDKVFKAIEDAWKNWQDAIKIGPILVTGAGVGPWAGSGAGGGLVPGPPFIVAPISFGKNSPENAKFTGEIFKAVAMKFNAWLPTYKFTAVPYVGTSGATPIAPGPVTALNTPGPLKTYGAGAPLLGISLVAKAGLTPPMFNLTAPEAKSGQLVDAIGKAIETAFDSLWLTTTQVTGSQLTAVGTPGGAVTAFPSTPGGKLV